MHCNFDCCCRSAIMLWMVKKVWSNQFSTLCRSATLDSWGTGTSTFSMWSWSSKQEAHGRIQCCKESWRRQTCLQKRVGSWTYLIAIMPYAQRTLHCQVGHPTTYWGCVISCNSLPCSWGLLKLRVAHILWAAGSLSAGLWTNARGQGPG